jgi:hypothetical protein
VGVEIAEAMLIFSKEGSVHKIEECQPGVFEVEFREIASLVLRT